MNTAIRQLLLLTLLFGVFLSQTIAQAQTQTLTQLPGSLSLSQPRLPATTGTVVVIPAYAEVRKLNDEARLTFAMEVQSKDKAVAISEAALKMKQGMDAIRREDTLVVLQTRGYYAAPIYASEIATKNQRLRPVIGWRVIQQLDATTINLGTLPKMVVAAQKTLALNGLQFGLSDATSRMLDEKRITATYQNLIRRIASIANAMHRSAADATLETVDWEASGAYSQVAESAQAKMMMRTVASEPMSEIPSFEPGEATLPMRLVARVRFK